MIHIFRESFWLFVKVEMNQRGRELDSFKKIIERAVDTETTAQLRPSSNTREMDQNCPQDNYPVQPTIARSPHQTRPTEDLSGEPGNIKLTRALYKLKTSHLLQFRFSRTKKPDKKSWREKKQQYH